MRSIPILLLFFIACGINSFAQMQTDTFTFSFEGRRYAGAIDLPEQKKPTALIILVPGSGKTDMVAGKWYHNLRRYFTDQGLACVVWDKAGCGKSEGVFNGDVSVQSSAQEAIVAIEELKRRHIQGSEKIGLWGLSRGGWVCPLIISSYPSIAFWISVSGPDGEENFGYLLETNFQIEGRSKKETRKLMKAWYANTDIARHGGTFEENMKATSCLRSDSFYTFITHGSRKPTLEGFLKWQKGFETGENMPINEKTGLQIYFPDFDKVLDKVNCPVLAIFGKKDSQVDWRKTKALYKETIGKNPHTTLAIKTFPNGNHIIETCKTGGYREKLEKREFCEGYLETMSSWLAANGLSGL
jgi:pimeloyl-ACP methyl ester carboxylesterase